MVFFLLLYIPSSLYRSSHLSAMTSSVESDQQIQRMRQQVLELAQRQQLQANQLTNTMQQLISTTEAKLARRERDLDRREQQIRQSKARLELERRYFEEEKQMFEGMRRSCVQIAFAGQQFVVLEVGGQHFETTPATLLSNPGCTLAYTFSRAAEYNPDKHVLRIDRNPKHFEKILDFMRRNEESLLWMDDPSLNSVELKEIKAEAVYYKLPRLVHIIGWELVKRQPVVTNLQDCGFKQPQTGKTEGFETTRDLTLRERNFSSFQFQSVLFKHSVSFRGCVLNEAVFKTCAFNALIDFGETDIEKLHFEECSGVCGPKETFVTTDAKGAECIPNHW